MDLFLRRVKDYLHRFLQAALPSILVQNCVGPCCGVRCIRACLMTTQAIAAAMNSLVSPLGFTRKRILWNRKSEPFVDVIDIQVSKCGGTLTINAGVLYPRAHNLCWGKEPSIFVSEPDCTVRSRIGFLIGHHDIWWDLKDEDVSADIVEKVSSYVLPFVEQMHSLDAIIAYLASERVAKQTYPPPIIYLAVLKSERGEKAAACDLLRDLESKQAGAWKLRVQQVMTELEC